MFDLFTSRGDAKASVSQSDPLHEFTVGLNNFSSEMAKLQSISAKDMEQESKRCDLYFKAIESWRNLETHYVNKLTEIQSFFKEKVESKNNFECQSIIDNELISLFETIIKNHREMKKKVEYDIVMVNLQTSNNLCKDIKEIIAEDKLNTKTLTTAKEQLEKVLTKKNKLRRSKEEELMLQIFMEDSVDCTMEQKIRRFNKFKEIEKEKEEYELKVSECVENYQRACDNSKRNHLKYYEKMEQFNECKYETVMKMQLHYLTFFRNQLTGIQQMARQEKVSEELTFSSEAGDSDHGSSQRRDATGVKSMLLFQELNMKQAGNREKVQKRHAKEYELLQKVSEPRTGYVEFSLKLIIDKEIDDLLSYSKDKQVKGRIKRMMESSEIDPQETDEVCRQVQLIKKIIRNNQQDQETNEIFAKIVKKNSKLRMNFVFMLQFFRLNGKFELSQEVFKPIYRLINRFMDVCHQERDSFVIKQLMILLTTYHVILDVPDLPKSSELIATEDDSSIAKTPEDNLVLEEKKLSEPLNLGGGKKDQKFKKEKIYILSFFKTHQIWKDIEFWESLLIECVYSEKKSTLKMLMLGLETAAQKKQMMEAQKTAIMNQVLYVVKNMIIFDFTEKDVKNFSSRFSKILKQDDKSLKDIYNTIESAAREQRQDCQTESIEQYITTYLT